MMMKKAMLLLMLIVVLAIMSQSASACTIFNAMGNGMILAGNNEDHDDPNGEIRFASASERKYGTITFAFGPFTQGGMNDQGLFFDFYAAEDFKVSPLLPGQILPSGEKTDKQPTLEEMVSLYTQYDVSSKKMLETCATVEEAVRFYQQYYEGTLGYGFLMIADKTGVSATITWDWDQNKMRVSYKNGSFQAIGVGSKKIFDSLNPGNYQVSVDFFKELLKSTSIDITAYSNVCDLQRGIVYVYNHGDFDHMVQFDLAQELAKGNHAFFVKDLFAGQEQ